jgi:hypothetical protein
MPLGLLLITSTRGKGNVVCLCAKACTIDLSCITSDTLDSNDSKIRADLHTVDK